MAERRKAKIVAKTNGSRTVVRQSHHAFRDRRVQPFMRVWAGPNSIALGEVVSLPDDTDLLIYITVYIP